MKFNSLMQNDLLNIIDMVEIETKVEFQYDGRETVLSCG